MTLNTACAQLRVSVVSLLTEGQVYSTGRSAGRRARHEEEGPEGLYLDHRKPQPEEIGRLKEGDVTASP